MSNKVAFFIETRDSEVRNVSFEAATVARNIAGETGGTPVGIAVGSGITDKLSVFGEYGVPDVIAVDNPNFSNYTSEGYTAAVADMAKNAGAGYLIIIGSAMGTDLAPRVAARLDTELVTDVIEINVSGGKIEAVKPVFAGKARITVTTSSDLQFVTLRPKVFSPEKEGAVTCEVKASDFDAGSVNIRALVKEIVKGAGDKIDLTEADIIVSGGRGMKEPDNFKMLEDMADVLGGVVGASRAVVDAGWRPHSDQVGQTGKTVTPKLYIAVGISGAIQHLAGMSSSKCIVAVNNDSDAPIFKAADYGIVGDLFEIVPVLTEEFKKVLD
ncbi:MAG: electron transfer flavoprotein subunit alpha/FixB family protein [bacterium]|nr:electron transfer flavoprotein subunit alpha/FixB family protein [bacterium]